MAEMAPTKISIITACYNSKKYIEDTIQSVIGQTYPDVEYIIVDGGSSDGTMEMINRYKDRIDHIISEPDQGVYDAFNKGIRAAKGDVICFLNSDDYFADDQVVADIAGIFNTQRSVKVVYGNVEIVNVKNGYSFVTGKAVTAEDLKKGILPPHPGMFAKKQLFFDLGGFDLQYRIASDFDLSMKMFKEHQQEARYLDRIISIFRLGGMSSNLRNSVLTRQETNTIVQKHWGTDTNRIFGPSDVNMPFYKKWLEVLLLHDRTISRILRSYQINQVALFGTREMALYVLADLQKSGIRAKAFLDNNPTRIGRSMHGISIHHPDWLKDHYTQIDGIILSFEGDYDEEARQQLKKILEGESMRVWSWKELVCLSEEME